MPTDKDELDATIEEPLDPSLPICDAHHHLWYNTDNGYTVEDLLQDISGGHHISRTVFVESGLMLREDAAPEMKPVGETEFVRKVTARARRNTGNIPAVAAGIVGFADLTLGDYVMPVLEAHIAAGKKRFRGIRNITAWDASPALKSRRAALPGLLMDRKFRRGFAALRRYGLSFDAWVYHTQLAEVVDLAREFPDTRVIVNHIGGPLGIGPYARKRDEVFQDWKRSISELAECANVSIKLGGLGMRIFGFGWHEAEKKPSSAELAGVFEPFFLWCIERFGVDRCMFESNFPVDKAAYSYTAVWNAFKRVTAGFSRDERLALFYNTAVNAYRLGD
ncbi:MAG: amidohydrolase [Chloroflexi bacterium RBG_13_57_8]|nr:MAG: amidohydrolase [Chloroflexi bacterium RBG_13_57_8]